MSLKRAGKFFTLLLLLGTLLYGQEEETTYGWEGDFYYAALENGSAAILGYQGPGGPVSLPSHIQGLPVSLILGETFVGAGITALTIPGTVTHIGDYAFEGNLISSLTIPSSVLYIGRGSFASNRIRTLSLSRGLEFIDDLAFAENQLRTLSIPDTVVSIGSWAFSDNHLTELVLEEGLTYIRYAAFERNDLRELRVPDSVVLIEETAFIDNPLRLIQLGAAVTIGEYEGAFFTFPLGFTDYYNSQGRRAGTYSLRGTAWEATFRED
ncbi:MAG: leucine-rich repeat domain-containing protein [Treponema sp.]|nr:leucine-rich repeat domain-containing protein [Treponema sp.]